MDEVLEKWDAAKAGTELLIAKFERALGDLNDCMDKHMDNLARLAEGYAGFRFRGLSWPIWRR